MSYFWVKKRQFMAEPACIDIKYHWLREHTYENGTVELEHCKTEDMHADVMTKALASEDHNKHAIHISGNEDV